MKLFLAFLLAGGIYLALSKTRPVPTAPNPVAQPAAAPHGDTMLSRPFVRTHEALDAARKNVRENQF